MVVPTPGRRAQSAGARRRASRRGRRGCSPSAARRRWPRSPTARRRFPQSTRSAVPATPTSPRPSGACSARSASTWWPACRRSSSLPTRPRIRTGWRWICSRRPNTTSWRRRSCCRPMRRCSTRWRRARSGRSSHMPRAGHHRRVVREPRRAGPVRDLDEACAIANRIAPEHLELAVADPAALVPKIRHAGAIFMGHHASEALGDYCAGPNHVLPTGRTARFSSPLGVYDFQKRTSLLGVPAPAARVLGQVAATLADGEGLPAHAQSAAISRERRMNDRLPATTGTDAHCRATIVAAVVRPEIRALTAYAVAKADRTRQARRQREPVRRCPTRCARRSPPPSPRVPFNRYPDGGADAVIAALRAAARRSRRARDPARQRLRRADPDHHLCAGAAGRRDARAGADVRHVPDERALRAACASSACRSPRLSRSTSPRWRRRSSASVRRCLSRVAEQSDRQPVRDGGCRAHPARGARARRRRRGLLRFRGRRASCRGSREFPNLLVLRTLSKIGMAALRLGYAIAAPEWIAELNKVRQPYNLNALTQAAAQVLLTEGALLDEQAAAIVTERARLAAALTAIPGVSVFPSQANFVLVRVPDAPRWFDALARGGHPRQESARRASAAGAMPADHGRHAGRKRRAARGAARRFA